MYQEQLRKLIMNGILGFVIGFIFAFCRSLDQGIIFSIGFSLPVGIFFSCLPYGWQLSGKVIGGIIIGNPVIMIVAFCLRFIIAMLTGWIAYPIALIYTFIKFRQE